MVMPAHVTPADLERWLAGVSLTKNVDGIIVTVPHKFACFEVCATASERAAFLLRRWRNPFQGDPPWPNSKRKTWRKPSSNA